MGKPDKSYLRKSNTKARRHVPFPKRLSASQNVLRKIPVTKGGLPSKDFGEMGKYYKYSTAGMAPKLRKKEMQQVLSSPAALSHFMRLVKTEFKNPRLPRTAGKYRGGANNFKRKVNNAILSRKLATQTRYSNVNVLKSAVDQLKKKLDKCEKKNKKLKESNIELSAWKHSMIKLTEKINRGNI